MPQTDLRQQILNAPVLIVDDNKANVLLLETILKATGYANVRSLHDPREVMALVRQVDFDLILLDVRMPHMDGFQLLAALQAARADDYLPVIMLTADSDRSTRIRSLSNGAKDFLTKPFDPTEVLRRAENVLTARLLLKERARRAEELEDAVRARTEELAASRLEIVRSLGRAGEYRDNETGRHILRMSRFCQLLAEAAGLGADFAKDLLEASPMHDVGKIGIPDAILLKPGKLTPEEFAIMQTHAAIGAEIIPHSDTPLITLARSVALTHHEKWDGSGYPNKLKGEEIPIEGRIVALCDVFDALTTRRPYKAPWPVEEAVAYIRDNAGKHFDPDLTEVFLKILPSIISVKEQLPELDDA